MKINPNDPATGFAYSSIDQGTSGITIRAQIAAMCLQGILSSRISNPELIAKDSIAYADALIKELNETTS